MLSDNQEKNLKALISMLDEPDEKVFKTLRKQVLIYEIDAYPLLEDAWMAANDILVTSRLEELMEDVNFLHVLHKFEEWINSLSFPNLLDAMILINRLAIPDVEEKLIREEVENIVKDTWLEINNNLTALEKIKVMNHIFFSVHKYTSPHITDDTTPSFYLSYLLENKTGNPSSMGILYLIVAQILQIPLLGVNLPGHLIVAYIDERFLLKDDGDYTPSDIMFYINPYNKGAVFTRNEIDLYIKQLKIDPKEKYYTPAGNKEIIFRYLKELEKSYKHYGKKRKQGFINDLLQLF